MPLARLIYRSQQAAELSLAALSAEDAKAALAQDPLPAYLRKLGYEVEVGVVGQTGQRAPDIEIEVEDCTFQQAIECGESFARQHPEAQIFFAPGVLNKQVPAREALPGAIENEWAEQKPHPGFAGWVGGKSGHREGEEREHAAETTRQQAEHEERERQRVAAEAEIAPRHRQEDADVLRTAQAKEAEAGQQMHSAEAPSKKAPEAIPHVEVQPAPTPTCDDALGTHVQPLADDAAAQGDRVAEAKTPALAGMPPPLEPAAAPQATEAPMSAVAPAPAPRRAVPPSQKAARRSAAGRPDITRPHPARSRHIHEWWWAAVAGAVFAVLLAGVWSIATSPKRTPSLPLMHPTSNIQQELPFGPVTITNPAAQTTPIPSSLPTAKAPAASPENNGGKPSAIVGRPAAKANQTAPQRQHTERR